MLALRSEFQCMERRRSENVSGNSLLESVRLVTKQAEKRHRGSLDAADEEVTALVAADHSTTLSEAAASTRVVSPHIFLPRNIADSVAGGTLPSSCGGVRWWRTRRRHRSVFEIGGTMTSIVKEIVSQNRCRFKDGQFNLDLSYVTDNIIAMGFPSDRLEGIYRNHIDDVVRFLEMHHKDRYKLYNLRRDHSYNVGRFHGRVSSFPMDDHHPPSLELMRPFCEDVHRWLSAREDNVVAVHCKAGKGRTGVMICAYLLYAGAHPNPAAALEYYGQKRTMDMTGVTIPSQRRYVEYYHDMLRTGAEYKKIRMQITAVQFDPLPTFDKNGTCSPVFSIYCGGTKVYKSPVYESSVSSAISSAAQQHSGGSSSSGASQPVATPLPPTTTPAAVAVASPFTMGIPDSANVFVEGDVRIDFCHKPNRLKKEKMFHFWFNTFFICPTTLRAGCGGSDSGVSAADKTYVGRQRSLPDLPDGAVRRNVVSLKTSVGSRVSTSTPDTGRIPDVPQAVDEGGDDHEVFPPVVSSSCPKEPSSLRCNPSFSPTVYATPLSYQNIRNEAGCHVLTLTKTDLDRAFKDKENKRFSCDFKVHVYLRCVQPEVLRSRPKRERGVGHWCALWSPIHPSPSTDVKGPPTIVRDSPLVEKQLHEHDSLALTIETTKEDTSARLTEPHSKTSLHDEPSASHIHWSSDSEDDDLAHSDMGRNSKKRSSEDDRNDGPTTMSIGEWTVSGAHDVLSSDVANLAGGRDCLPTNGIS